MEIELINTVNKSHIEIEYFIRDKLTMKTVKHNNAQRDNWQHDVILSVSNRLFNPCSMTQGRRDSTVNHEKAYSAYFEADKIFQMTIDVTCLET